MRRLFRLLFLPLGAVAMLAFAPVAAATHNADQHSPNVVHDANVPGTTFQNTDFAFWGNLAVNGNYGGFRIYDISSPQAPVLLSDFSCPGAQGDPSVWRNVLIISVDDVLTGPDCGSPPARPVTSPTGWEGIRIFDISTPRAPRFVKGVYADCGSHTNTLVPDPARNRVLVYITSYSLRSGPGCGPGNPQGEDPLHRKISIAEIPLNDPAAARLIAERRVDVPVFDAQAQFGDPRFNPTASCHDIQVFLELKVAAAACVSQAQLWDISDLDTPKTLQPLARIDEPAVDFYHSAAFTWDGKYVVFGDEAFQEPSECLQTQQHGRMWAYRVANPETLVSSFMVPRPQGGQYCTAHLYNFVPINGRYVMASSWYEGATSVIDFTNPAAPREIGFYDAQVPIAANAWATYWYRDYIFASDRQRPTTRGLDVFHLTEPWRTWAFDFARENPQTQERLLRCTVRATSAQLRARRRATLTIRVRAAGGQVLPNQPVVRAPVRLRGVGVSKTLRTDRSGIGRVSVRPTRKGVLRVGVRDINILGCSTRRGVAGARVQPRLTGSR